MCLILYKPAGAEFDANLLYTAQRTNPHGVGFMMPGGNGTVRTAKGLWEPEKVRDFWERHKQKPLAVHFRMRTQGEINTENCHPFQVLRKSRHGIDLWMMHNGTIQIGKKEPKKSDTYNFVYYGLRPLLEENPQRIYEPEFQRRLSGLVGGWNKLLFMDGDANVIIVNKQAGTERNGCWLSNTYSIRQTAMIPWSNRYDDDEDYYTYGSNGMHQSYPPMHGKPTNIHISTTGSSLHSTLVRINQLKQVTPVPAKVTDVDFDVVSVQPSQRTVVHQLSTGNYEWIETLDHDGWPKSGRYRPLDKDSDGDEVQ